MKFKFKQKFFDLNFSEINHLDPGPELVLQIVDVQFEEDFERLDFCIGEFTAEHFVEQSVDECVIRLESALAFCLVPPRPSLAVFFNWKKVKFQKSLIKTSNL